MFLVQSGRQRKQNSLSRFSWNVKHNDFVAFLLRFLHRRKWKVTVVSRKRQTQPREHTHTLTTKHTRMKPKPNTKRPWQRCKAHYHATMTIKLYRWDFEREWNVNANASDRKRVHSFVQLIAVVVAENGHRWKHNVFVAQQMYVFVCWSEVGAVD